MGTTRGPVVYDFSASIWPRFTKSGIQLPYDHPPRGNSIYFEIHIFYRLLKSALDLSNLPIAMGTTTIFYCEKEKGNRSY